MYLPDTYQMKVVMFRKGEKGKTSHKSIDVDSFLKLVYSDEYQQKLKEKKLPGLLTHQGRSTARQANIPHADSVFIDPNLCNVLTGVSDDDEAVYGYLDLTDTKAAERFKSLWKMGVKFGVSISTELQELGDKFIIKRLNGIDITALPEFNAPILEANFSEGNEIVGADYPLDNPMITIGNFSLRDYIRERQVAPRRVLQSRIREVILFNKNNKKMDGETHTYMRQYLSSYIKRYLNKCVRAKGNVNIIYELGLDQYISNRQALRTFNMIMNTAKQELQQTKVISTQTQKRLNDSFDNVMNLLYDYINNNVEASRLKGKE